MSAVARLGCGARPDAFEAIDVLFVDEAAQMSLANVLAVSQSAKTVVLIGDPQQLDQPTQGSHPDGTDASALDHVLATKRRLIPNRVCFLRRRGGCILTSAPILRSFSMTAS